MNKNRKDSIIFLLVGVLFFVIFAVDVQYDRDVWTWLWLLQSILNLMTSFKYQIRYELDKRDGKE
jgi:Ca2+/Na+ antiporter